MQPRKILVVDDSKLLHKMYEVVLGKFPLVHALDGREALARLAEHRDVDLVLLDINMPNMNGIEVLQHLKAESLYASVPVVVV
jgi:putative two-component system response regulator